MNSTIIYLIYCKNFYKYHNIPPPSTTIKKEMKQNDQVDTLVLWFVCNLSVA
jgi:hypothetical protein